MKIKAVIFDIDGVLIDSFRSNFKFVKRFLTEAGYKAPTEKQYRKGFHLTLDQVIRVFAGVDDAKEIKRIVRIAFKVYTISEKVKLPEDSVFIIKKLSKSYKLGLVTGRIKLGVDEYLDLSKTRKYFKTAVHFSHYKNSKPHPEPLLIAAKRLKVKPSEAVYIGDALTDIQAAKAAGMKVILFSKKNLKGADYKTNSFKALPGIIKKI